MRLVVITTAALGDGFRLAGAATVIATPGAGAEPLLRDVVARPDVALVAVTDDIWQGLPERTRASLESRAQPIVLGVPTGRGGVVAPDAGAGLAAAGQAIERAIGHRLGPAGNARQTGPNP